MDWADAIGEDGKSDVCIVCSEGGMLIACDGCPRAYHVGCLEDIAGMQEGCCAPLIRITQLSAGYRAIFMYSTQGGGVVLHDSK